MSILTGHRSTGIGSARERARPRNATIGLAKVELLMNAVFGLRSSARCPGRLSAPTEIGALVHCFRASLPQLPGAPPTVTRPHGNVMHACPDSSLRHVSHDAFRHVGCQSRHQEYPERYKRIHCVQQQHKST